MEGILKWNKVINLTSIVEPEEFIVKHYIDSLLCVPFEEFQAAKTVVDVGTGGGFPGIPLALAAPEKQFVLIEEQRNWQGKKNIERNMIYAFPELLQI